MSVKKEDYLQVNALKLPYLVLVVAMLLTIGATYIFYKNEAAKDLTRFQNETGRFKSRFEGKVRGHTSLLKAVRGFIESNKNLTKNSLAGFVKSLEIEKNYPEIKTVGISKKSQPPIAKILQVLKKQAFETSADNFSELQLAENQVLVPIESDIEGQTGSASFDSIDKELLDGVIAQACDTGEPVTTGKIKFVSKDNNKSTGFMVFMAVYKDAVTPPTIKERRESLEGIIYDSINTEELLLDTEKSSAISGVSATIYENIAEPKNLMMQTAGEAESANGLTAASEVKFGNKIWQIHFQSLPEFDQQSGIGWTPVIIIIGVTFSLLLFGLTYLDSSARARSEKIAEELRESEREKGFLLEREQKARQQAEESSRAKDHFISIVSHELRTPLNSIAGWSKILHTHNLSEEIKTKALQTIDKNVRMQTKMVEDLLDLSQIFSNDQDIIKREFNISEMFEEICKEAKTSADEKRVSIIKENQLPSVFVTGDDDKLKKVLLNLFSNAVKFTPPNGEIFAGIYQRGKNIEIKIKDTGQGIKSEFLSKIFEHFNQADSSLTRSFGGLGLGLAITRRIVEMHNGKIFAESGGEGKGAEFTILLPQNIRQNS